MVNTAHRLSGKALAEHWGCSDAYVSKLRHKHGMPEFATPEEADVWRARFRQRSNVRSERAPTSPANAEVPPDEPIDVEAVLAAAGGDFDAAMIKHAEEVPILAYALYQAAIRRGNDALVSVRVKNWGEAAKQAGLVREKFLEIQEKTRALIHLDEVLNVLGTELQALRVAMLKLGERHAAAANPENPPLAKAVIDAGVDAVFRQMDQARLRVDTELRRQTEGTDGTPEAANASVG